MANAEEWRGDDPQGPAVRRSNASTGDIILANILLVIDATGTVRVEDFELLCV
jgi:hypothetical protein